MTVIERFICGINTDQIKFTLRVKDLDKFGYCLAKELHYWRFKWGREKLYGPLFTIKWPHGCAGRPKRPMRARGPSGISPNARLPVRKCSAFLLPQVYRHVCWLSITCVTANKQETQTHQTSKKKTQSCCTPFHTGNMSSNQQNDAQRFDWKNEIERAQMSHSGKSVS